MTFEEITVGQSKEMPEKIILYGVPKIGKSRFAGSIDDVFFINAEGGLNYLDKQVRATPKLESFDEVIGWLMHILESDFTAGALALDTLDWIEEMARTKISKAHGGKSLNDKEYKPFGYGAGVGLVNEQTFRVFTALDLIWAKKRIPAIILAHSKVKDVDVPTKEDYSQFQLKLSTGLAKKAMEWADLILFADYDFAISSEGITSDPVPMLYGGGSMAFEGGGRMKLDKKLPMNYEALKNHITKGA